MSADHFVGASCFGLPIALAMLPSESPATRPFLYIIFIHW